MNTAFELLTELTVDPFRLNEFRTDPARLSAELGVLPEDLARILHPSSVAAGETWSRCASIFDPGQDPLPDPDVPPPPDDDA